MALRGTGRKAVAVPGTEQPLSATGIECSYVVVRAVDTNTKIVAVGTASVNAAAGSEAGILLAPGDPAIRLEVTDVSSVYVDAQVGAEAVAFAYGD